MFLLVSTNAIISLGQYTPSVLLVTANNSAVTTSPIQPGTGSISKGAAAEDVSKEGSYTFQLTILVTVSLSSSSQQCHRALSISEVCHRSLEPPHRLLRGEQVDVPQSLRRCLREAHLSLSNPSSVDNNRIKRCLRTLPRHRIASKLFATAPGGRCLNEVHTGPSSTIGIDSLHHAASENFLPTIYFGQKIPENPLEAENSIPGTRQSRRRRNGRPQCHP